MFFFARAGSVSLLRENWVFFFGASWFFSFERGWVLFFLFTGLSFSSLEGVELDFFMRVSFRESFFSVDRVAFFFLLIELGPFRWESLSFSSTKLSFFFFRERERVEFFHERLGFFSFAGDGRGFSREWVGFFLVRELRIFFILRKWSFFLTGVCFLFVMTVEFEKERASCVPFFHGIFFFRLESWVVSSLRGLFFHLRALEVFFLWKRWVVFVRELSFSCLSRESSGVFSLWQSWGFFLQRLWFAFLQRVAIISLERVAIFSFESVVSFNFLFRELSFLLLRVLSLIFLWDFFLKKREREIWVSFVFNAFLCQNVSS